MLLHIDLNSTYRCSKLQLFIFSMMAWNGAFNQEKEKDTISKTEDDFNHTCPALPYCRAINLQARLKWETKFPISLSKALWEIMRVYLFSTWHIYYVLHIYYIYYVSRLALDIYIIYIIILLLLFRWHYRNINSRYLLA